MHAPDNNRNGRDSPMRQRRELKTETEDKGKGAERRTAPRLPPTAIEGLRGAKLVAGPEVRLVNISRGGALLETRARLLIGASVSVKLTTKDGFLMVRGSVLRSRVSVVEAGMILYESALVFDEEFTQLTEGAVASGAISRQAEITTEDYFEDSRALIEESLREATAPAAAAGGTVAPFPGSLKRTASQR